MNKYLLASMQSDSDKLSSFLWTVWHCVQILECALWDYIIQAYLDIFL